MDMYHRRNGEKERRIPKVVHAGFTQGSRGYGFTVRGVTLTNILTRPRRQDKIVECQLKRGILMKRLTN